MVQREITFVSDKELFFLACPRVGKSEEKIYVLLIQKERIQTERHGRITSGRNARKQLQTKKED